MSRIGTKVVSVFMPRVLFDTNAGMSKAVKAHMKQKMAFDISAGAADAAQNLLMAVGLLGALYIGVYQVIYGGKTVGQFATLTTYWAQFTGGY